MSALMLNFNKVIAQADSIPTYSSFGIFDKVMNRFGEIQSWNNLRIEQDALNPILTVNQGIFNLNFYEGCGLENTLSVEHNQKRQVFLELFSFANEAFGNGLANGSVSIRFLPMNTTNPIFINEPIAASSFYIIPEFSEGFSEISDCVLSQIINGRKNPYFEVGSYPTKQNILNNSLGFSHLDFYLNLDSFNTNTNLNQSTIATNQIDLYSVALRELLVSLGLNSMLQENGTSLSPNQNQYSRLDEQLKFGSEKFLVYNPSTKKYALNTNINFNSIFNFSSPSCDSLLSCSLSPTISDSIIKLSISSCFKIGYEYTFINGSCDPSLSILERSWLYGAVRRTPSSKDIKLLESIGFKINGCFGRQEFSTSFCNSTLPELTVNSTSFLGITEVGSYQFVIKDPTSSIAYTNFIDDYTNLDSIEILDYIGNNNTVNANPNALEIIFQNSGQQIVRFRIKYDQTHYTTSYLVLRFRGGGGCFETCNLIGNGSFENISSLITCGAIFPLGVDVDLDCWSTYASTSPDLFTISCPDWRCDFEGNGDPSWDTQIPLNTAPPSSSILHLLARRIDTFDGINVYEEAAQSELAEPLIVGNTYEMSLRVLRRPNIGIPVLRISFRNGEYVATGSDYEINAADPSLFHVFNEEIEEEYWQTITFQFECTEPGLDFIVVHNEASGPPAGIPAERDRSLLIDNLRLSIVPNATFNIPQEFSCGSLISSLQNFATPAGGVVTGPGVLGTTNFTFSPVLAGPGTHTLTYTVTTANGCVLTAFDEVVVHPTINFNNADVNPTCGQACNGSITLNPSLSAPATVTYSWTGPSINSGNQNLINLTNLCAGTYTVTATINGVCTRTQSFTITNAPAPTATATTNIDLCSATGCNNSILVTTNSPNNTISWTGNITGFNPTNLCPGSYTATVTSPQGCSVQVPVTINFTAGPNLTVSNTQTLNLSNLSYTNITVASGGFLTITTTGTSTLTIGTMIDVQSGGRLRINNAQIRFLQPAMLRVRQGGRVEIIGGRLSAFCPGTFWHGIEVWGTPNNSQQAVDQSITNFSQPDFDGNNGQGGIRIRTNAVVEYARIGVRLFSGPFTMFGTPPNSGGYISTDKAIFRNNNRDIAGGTFTSDNYSKLRRTEFILDNNSLDQSSTLQPRVQLLRSKGIVFEGCKWSNVNANFLNANATEIERLTGLSLTQSTCTVQEHIIFTTTTRSKFEGFAYGIKNSTGQCPDCVQAMVIRGSDFKCYRGIYASNWISTSSITSCAFNNLNTATSISIEIPPCFLNSNSGNWVNSSTNSNGASGSSGPAYGIYLDACSNTYIQFNLFDFYTINEANQRVGCYVNNCGAASIKIHENAFRNTTYGIRAFNVNRNTNLTATDGTTFSCNQFAQTTRRAVEIRASVLNNNAGINSNIYVNDFTSRSNEFLCVPNIFFPTARFILSQNTGPHAFRSYGNEVYPNSDQISIGSNPNILVPFQDPNCGIALPLEDRNNLRIQALLKSQEYLSFKDDGNSEYYKNQIEGIDINNILLRYNELMALSPALSSENILEVLEKEQQIPRSMLLSLLVSNASSLKNGDVIDKLEDLSEPLSVWETDSILAAMEMVDAKELLLIELNTALEKYYQKHYEDYLAIRLDSTIENKDSVLFSLKQEVDLLDPKRSNLFNSLYQLDWSQMINTIEDWQAEIKEDSHEFKDLNYLSILVGYAKDQNLHQDSTCTYSGFAKDFILNEFPLTYRAAVFITNLFDPVSYHGDLDYEYSTSNTRLFKPGKKINEVKSEVQLFPNPASDVVMITTESLDLLDAIVKCTDISGRQTAIEVLSKSEHDCVLNVSTLANGSYFITIQSAGTMSTNPLIISK